MKQPLTIGRVCLEMARSYDGRAEAEAAARLATPLFWAAGSGANVALLIGRDLADAAPALGVALVCEGAIYLALWSFMGGVRWAASETGAGRSAPRARPPSHSQCQGSNG